MSLATELIYEPEAAEFSRPVSPSILEHRILKLKQDLRTAESRAVKAEAERDLSDLRVRQFEALVQNLALALDKATFTVEQILGEDLRTG